MRAPRAEAGAVAWPLEHPCEGGAARRGQPGLDWRDEELLVSSGCGWGGWGCGDGIQSRGAKSHISESRRSPQRANALAGDPDCGAHGSGASQAADDVCRHDGDEAGERSADFAEREMGDVLGDGCVAGEEHEGEPSVGGGAKCDRRFLRRAQDRLFDCGWRGCASLRSG